MLGPRGLRGPGGSSRPDPILTDHISAESNDPEWLGHAASTSGTLTRSSWTFSHLGGRTVPAAVPSPTGGHTGRRCARAAIRTLAQCSATFPAPKKAVRPPSRNLLYVVKSAGFAGAPPLPPAFARLWRRKWPTSLSRSRRTKETRGPSLKAGDSRLRPAAQLVFRLPMGAGSRTGRYPISVS
jgi:hypothetical protein